MWRARGFITLTAGLGLFARGYWRVVAILALASMTAALVTGIALSVLSDLAWAERETLFAAGAITAGGILRLTLLVGIPAAVVVAIVALISIAAVAVVQGDVRLGRAPSLPAAIAVGARRAPAFAGALLTAVLAVLLAIALAPLICLAALAVVLVRGVGQAFVLLRARRLDAPVPPRRPRSPWLSWRMLLVCVIPFGLAAMIWVHSLLLLPVAVHEKLGALRILRRSRELTRGRVFSIAGLAALGAASYALVQYGIDALRLTGIDPGLVGWMFALAQPLLAGLPIALLVAAYFAAVGGTPRAPAVTRPSLARRPLMIVTATTAATALVIGVVVGMPADSAWADETPNPIDQIEPQPTDPPGEGGGGGVRPQPQSFSVDSLGDGSDATPGDGLCATAQSTCTVRAAIEENNTLRPTGVSAIVPATAEIAGGTVRLHAPLEVTYPIGFDARYGFEDTAPGMTLDGAHSTQLLRYDTAWQQGSQWYDLTFTRGFAGTGTQGGAVHVTRGYVAFERVTFDDNHATTGAHAVYAPGDGGQISSTQSRFVDNGVPACGPGFGATQYIFPPGLETTIDAEDASCEGTVSSAGSISTSVSVSSDPVSPRRGGAVRYSAAVTPAQQGLNALAGTVTFTIDGADPVEVPVDADGRAQTAALVAPGAESYTVRASYSGSAGYRASLGETQVATAGALSSVTLTAASDADTYWYRGHPLTLTADVRSATPGTVPTGTVTFVGGDDVLGDVPVGPDGRATLTTTITTADGQSHGGSLRWGIHAFYDGDAEHPASETDIQLYLAPDRTTVAITPSVAAASPGEPVTFTARVSSLEPGAGVVRYGQVRFSTPEGLAAPIHVDAQGEASITLTSLGFGSHQISASYGSATERYLPSSGLHDYSVAGTVASATTITRLSPTTTAPGDEVSFLVGVGATPGAAPGLPEPTGTVRLLSGDTLLDQVALGSNTTVRTTALPLGTHEVRVEYLGDTHYRASSATVGHTVAKAPTRTSLSASSTTTVVGEPIDFTVGVATSTVGQVSQPLTSGTVEIHAGASLIARIDLAGGTTVTASIPTSVGTHTVRAVFLGDDRYAGSQSTGYAHQQTAAHARVQLGVVATDLPYSGIIEAAATVTGISPTSLHPTSGTVRLRAGGIEVAHAPLSTDGTARFFVDASVLLPGSHVLTAELDDSPWFADSTSAPVTVTIAQHTPALTMSTTGDAQTYWGRAVELRAGVTLPWPTAPTENAEVGTIEFSVVTDGARTVLGHRTVTEHNRAAVFAIDPDDLAVGDHEFHARFSPSVETTVRLTPADAGGVRHTVLAVPTTVALGGLDGLVPGVAFVRTVMVSEDAAHATGTAPLGTATVTLDGTSLGSHAVVRHSGVPGSVVDVAFPALAAGEHRITVDFAPDAGASHQTRSQDFVFVVGTISPLITMTVAERTVQWDAPVWVQAAVKPRFDTEPEPRGTIVVSDGVQGGARCEIRVIPGVVQPQSECALIWSTAGSRVIQARFEPADSDLTYEPADSAPVAITVARRAVTLDAGMTHSGIVAGSWTNPTAGDTLTTAWTAYGIEAGDRAPAGDVTVTVTPADAAVATRCSTSLSSGTCEFPLTLDAAQRDSIAVTVSYPGDDRYAPATWTGSVAPRACIALRLNASPAGAGTVTPTQAPNCGAPGAPKSGYAVGTALGFTAAALPTGTVEFDWRAPERVDTASGPDILTVSKTHDWATAVFTKGHHCTFVTIVRTSARGTSGEVLLPGMPGSGYPAPNCPTAMAGGSLPAFSAWTSTSSVTGTDSTRVHTAAYLRGTEIGVALAPGRADTKVYAFSSTPGWVRSGEWAVTPRTVGASPERIAVTFGPTCYPASAAAEGRGTVSILNATNCADPTTGTTGWYADTVLDVYAAPTSDPTTYPFVRTWAGTSRSGAATQARGDSDSAAIDTVLVRHSRAELRAARSGVEQVDTVRILPGAAAPAIVVAFGQCHALTTGIAAISSNGSASGATRVSAHGDCPHPLASPRFYDERTELTVEAIAPITADLRYPNARVSQTTFSGWQVDRDTAARTDTPLVADNPIRMRMDRDHTLLANFHFSYDCAQVNISTTDAASLSVTGALPGVDPYCQRGSLESSGVALSGTIPRQIGKDAYAPVGELVISAQPAAGLDPQLGWTFTSTVRDYSGRLQLGGGNWTETSDTRRTYRNTIAGSTVRMPLTLEYLNAKAVACQEIDARVDMVTPDGQTLSDYTGDDQLILVYPAPNCPFMQNAYIVGTEVELWALGNPLGYRFTGWGGDLAADDTATDVGASQLAAELGDESAFLDDDFPPGVLRTVTMDGASPTLSVVAGYDAVCYDVTIEGNAGSVDWYPAPNCPGAEGEVTTTEYSDKALLDTYGRTQAGQARDYVKMRKMRGPQTMTGSFVGGTEVLIQAESQSNRVWTGWRGDAVQVGRINPGTISVDADKVVQNTYRAKDTLEQLEDFGNDIAVFAKKAVGFTAVVLTEYLKYYPPLGAVTGIAEGMSLVGTLLEIAGVSKGAVEYLHYAKQMIDLPFSLISCAGTWGLGSDPGIVKAAASNTASALKQGTYRITNITEAAMDEAKHVMSMQAGNKGLLMSAKLRYYSGKLALAELAPRIAPAVGVGVAVYGAIEGVGVSWDSSAASAWTNGSAYTDCLRKAVPQFMYDALGDSGQSALRDFTTQVAEGMQSGALWTVSGNLPGEGGRP